MKKRVILFLVTTIIFLNMTSAANYVCADGSELTKISRDIDLGYTKDINGLSLGLAWAEETLAIDRISADLYLNPVRLVLTEVTPSAPANFSDNTKTTISIVNSTESSAILKIGGSEKTMEENEQVSSGGVEVFLFKSEGSYPGTANIELLVGKRKLYISNLNNTQLINFNNSDYILNLVSVGKDVALVSVSICDKKNMSIVDKSTIVNTIPEEEVNLIENQSNSTQNVSESNLEGNTEKFSLNNDLIKNIALYGLGASIVLFIIVYFVLHRKKKEVYGTTGTGPVAGQVVK